MDRGYLAEVDSPVRLSGQKGSPSRFSTRLHQRTDTYDLNGLV
jgi:hypothetical protein